jgi:hypothetical protein
MVAELEFSAVSVRDTCTILCAFDVLSEADNHGGIHIRLGLWNGLIVKRMARDRHA